MFLGSLFTQSFFSFLSVSCITVTFAFNKAHDKENDTKPDKSDNRVSKKIPNSFKEHFHNQSPVTITLCYLLCPLTTNNTPTTTAATKVILIRSNAKPKNSFRNSMINWLPTMFSTKVVENTYSTMVLYNLLLIFHNH